MCCPAHTARSWFASYRPLAWQPPHWSERMPLPAPRLRCALQDERIQMAFQATSAHPTAAAAAAGSSALAAPSFHAGPLAAAAALDAGGSARQRQGNAAAAAARWRSAAAEAAAALREGVREGVEAVTQGVRQLSFTPGGSAAPAPAGSSGSTEGNGATVAGRTRSSSRTGGRGFGSPVQ